MTLTALRSALPCLLCTISLTALPLNARAEDVPPAPAAEAPPALPEATPAPEPAALPPAEPAQPAALPPPVAAPAPAAVQTGVGSMEVFSDQPGAEVVVDGRRMGVTPLRVDGLTSGSHTITVTREGGAPVSRDVLIQEGLTVRVDTNVAGAGPTAPQPAMASQPEGAPPAAASKSGGLPGAQFFGTFLEQPWAWAAAAVCGASLLVAAVLWTTKTPAGLPGPAGEYMGNLTANVSPNVWLAVRIGALVFAGISGAAALALFIWPSLPFAKMFTLPSMQKTVSGWMGKKEDKPAPAAAPAS